MAQPSFDVPNQLRYDYATPFSLETDMPISSCVSHTES